MELTETRELSLGLVEDFDSEAQGRGIQVALQGDLVFDVIACCSQIGRPVDAERVATGTHHVREHRACAFCEQYYRYLTAVFFAHQAVDDLLHARQRKTTVIVALQGRSPGVEDLDGLRPGLDLSVEVIGGNSRDFRQHLVENFRLLFGEALYVGEFATRTALDHVGADRPRTARETDQRHLAVELAADRTLRHRRRSRVCRSRPDWAACGYQLASARAARTWAPHPVSK